MLKDYRDYVIQLYNEYLDKKENRSISYGEVAYFERLNKKKLKEIEKELLEVLSE